MKKFLTVLCVCAALATASFDADAARRLGGGASFGRSAPTFSQKAPTPGAAPLSAKKPAAQQNSSTARTNPAATTQRPSMMRSILTGLAAALGISALLSLLGINGSGMVSVIMGLILVVAAVLAFKLFMNSRRRQPQTATASASQHDIHMPKTEEPIGREDSLSSEMRADQATVSTATGAKSGSVLDQFMNANTASATVEQEGAVDITPADFDREGFLQTARDNYIKLQAAWDSGNVITLSDFTTNDVFIAITHQLRERGNEAYTTKILSLSNELLGIAREGEEYVASVRFIGKLSINGEDELVDETWTLVKPVEGKGGWLLAGIKQNEPAVQA